MCFSSVTGKFATSRSHVGYLNRFDLDPEVDFTLSLNIPLPMKTTRNGLLFFHIILTKKRQGTDWVLIKFQLLCPCPNATPNQKIICNMFTSQGFHRLPS